MPTTPWSQSRGGEAHDAWKEEPVTTDSAMNMGAMFERLSEFRRRLDSFEEVLGRATLPRRRRVVRRRWSTPSSTRESARLSALAARAITEVDDSPKSARDG